MHIIPVLTGPTGAGKSSLLYGLHEDGLHFEVVSADAFQVYKRFDIGTAKPSASIRRELPHYLVDIVEPADSFDAGDFVKCAETAIADILARGTVPVVAGGTFFYIKALCDGIFNAPPVSSDIRAAIRDRIAHEGSAKLYAELLEIDVEYAKKIHEHDIVRIARALEIYQASGITFSVAHRQFHQPPKYQYKIISLDKERSVLYNDINSRVRQMCADGWQDEVRALLASGITTAMPAFRALGYREIAETITSGLSLDVAIERIAQKTRNYAKRQLTWARNMYGVSMLDIGEARGLICELYSSFIL
ncbi:tRNA (adenosine(37)-N6)-dimethylallyltransferase MiaA [Deferribacterales bacterium RsTz2092]|nr:tRNA dimethylallyltransferase [Deferribacterales bacterium]